MDALNNLKIKGLKNLKINGFKFLKVNELKHLIPKPGGRDDMELGDLIKSKKEVEIKIRTLFREKEDLESRIEKKELESRVEKKELESQIEKKELESRTGRLQETKDEKRDEISEFPWRKEIFPPLRRNMHHEVSRSLEVETDTLQKEDTGISERIDSQTGKKVEESDKFFKSKETGEIEEANITEIGVKEEANSAGEKNDVKGDEKADFDDMRKKAGEIAFLENTDKPETVEVALEDNEKGENTRLVLENNKKEEDKTPEMRKTESENPAPSIFGNSLIQELLESEELCSEEEQNFMKYIGESSVSELIVDLKEVKGLLTEAGS
ncbi:hypothetical protein A9239_04895 [Methanosarcina sp. A14]|uniref:Uncharacterized protein n=4 Tax=Methanosarcina TaxID=2207 RepID=A0A0E3QT60_METBA|nr:hypothetical protein [Methanosarcina barkeri]AKB53699.1 hypothetical protein MSBRM_0701 [Methanosarcina barkeri MS]AKB58191.1 hypothetical protein MSBR2_1675 [Methanosarcina barkeri 227]OEC90115.1 hypothetical protein A9239_04895 [Methanosarcina sp. A14]